MARLITDGKKKLLFIHVAKTGGTFFRETINRYGIPNWEVGSKHSPYSEFNLDDYDQVIGYIRNPIDWYRSRWSYSMQTYFSYQLQYNKWAKHHWMAKVWSEDLNQFVENTLREFPDGIAYKYFNKMLDLDHWDTTKIQIYRTGSLPYTLANIIEDFTGVNRLQEIMKLPRKNESVYDWWDTLVDNKSPEFERKFSISPNLQNEIRAVEYRIYKMFF